MNRQGVLCVRPNKWNRPHREAVSFKGMRNDVEMARLKVVRRISGSRKGLIGGDMKSGGSSAFFRRSIVYPMGVLLNGTGLLTLLIFVIYECIQSADVVASVPQVIVATLTGFLLVLVGFGLMVVGLRQRCSQR